MTIDYSKVVADQHTGRIIGRMYMERDSAITSQARQAYLEFAQQVRAQFHALPIKVETLAVDPYGSAGEMFDDIRRNYRLKVWGTQAEQAHPLLNSLVNDMFRAVHDYHGHFMTGRDFSRHGEEAAWVRHSQMFSGLARRAMTTETRGQTSAFIWVNEGREFPPQKAILLPEWVSEIPRQFS